MVVALNKGAVDVPPPMLEDRLRFFPDDAFDLNPFTIGAFALTLLIGLGLVSWNWWTHGRDREYLTQYYLTNDPRQRTEPLGEHVPVAVEFGPPQNMRPAELGLILDESADPKDVTATIVDLAVRGHITITELPAMGGLEVHLEGRAGGRADAVREDDARRPCSPAAPR